MSRYREQASKAAYAIAGLGFPLVNRWRDLRWRGAGERIVLLSFDVDYDRDEESLPAVLGALRSAGVPASFACVGVRVARHSDRYRAIVDAGHEILNHSNTHPDNRETCPGRSWRQLDPGEKLREVEGAQRAIEDVLGHAPAGFRLPHFGNVREPDEEQYYRMLSAAGLQYSSSRLDFRCKGGAMQEHPPGVFEVPVTTCPYHPFTAMDSYHVLRSPRLIYRLVHARVDLSESLGQALVHCRDRGLPLNIYLDPLDVAGDHLGTLIRHGKALDFSFMTYSAYVARWRGLKEGVNP